MSIVKQIPVDMSNEEDKMLSRVNPARDVVTLREAMNRLFDESFFGTEGSSERMAQLPIDVYGTDNEFVILAALPGVSLDDVKITVEGETLTISGEIPSLLENVDYLYSERFHGKFIRTLRLNAPFDVDKIEATLEKGILTLVLPKAEAAKPKQITIKAK
jgi:HSP20 family protein